MENLKEFILFLAKKVDPKRLYPFPEAFRSDTREQKLNSAVGTDASFLPYTDKEFQHYMQVLNTIPDNERLENCTAEQQQLLDYLYGVLVDISYHGKSIHPSITEYEFKYDAVSERLRDHKYRKRWYLFHGSKLGNWHSIIRNGIKNMSKTSLMSTGAALGPGVYLTTDLSMALSYGMSGVMSCISVVEILEDPTQYKKNNGVYVIPNDKILLPRYLYQAKNYRVDSNTSTELLNYYTNSKNQQLEPLKKSMKKRIDADLEKMTNEKIILLEQTGEDTYSIIIRDIIFNLYLDKYPFSAPIFKLMYELDKKCDLFNVDGVYTSHMNNWAPKNNLSSVAYQILIATVGCNMTDKETTSI